MIWFYCHWSSKSTTTLVVVVVPFKNVFLCETGRLEDLRVPVPSVHRPLYRHFRLNCQYLFLGFFAHIPCQWPGREVVPFLTLRHTAPEIVTNFSRQHCVTVTVINKRQRGSRIIYYEIILLKNDKNWLQYSRNYSIDLSRLDRSIYQVQIIFWHNRWSDALPHVSNRMKRSNLQKRQNIFSFGVCGRRNFFMLSPSYAQSPKNREKSLCPTVLQLRWVISTWRDKNMTLFVFSACKEIHWNWFNG